MNNAWLQQIHKYNSLLNICPQGYLTIVERLGSFNRIENAGLFLAIPVVDKLKQISIMEQSHRIEPSKIITSDNVTLSASGNLYIKIIDPEKACYASENPIYAVVTHAESSLRSALGSMELDAILNGRTEINRLVRRSMKEAADTWGLQVLRYEVTEIVPDHLMTESMNKQATAERDRREQILNAEGSETFC